MTEVEQTCDRVGIIRRGRLVVEGTVDELRGGDSLRVRAEPVEEARRLVAGLSGIEQIRIVDGALRITTKPAMAPASSSWVSSQTAAGHIVRMDGPA